ncbi:hypothetical protein M405DRAFT_931267 [Rhizopogon salebrosus TDB-379]|nr:hypothetical protein M405DRAFT_931267 [Rhizopogon salebrosus TDB-379]
MARCTIPDMFELIATGSSPLSGVHNNLTLSSLSNSSPTAVAFAKARTRTYAETGTRVTSTVADNDHSMIHHYATIPDVFEFITTPLSRPSKGSPTVIEFAKAGAGHHFFPPSTPASNLGDTCGNRYGSAKDQLYRVGRSQRTW